MGFALGWLALAPAIVLRADTGEAQKAEELQPVKPAQAARNVAAFTGAPTRVVWQRDGGLGTFDTQRTSPEVELKFKGFNVARPIITPDGKQIVFIDYARWASYIVDWDGRNLRKIIDARITHLRPDDSGKIHFYAQTRDNEVYTATLDKPAGGRIVWRFDTPPRERKSTNFQTSADGRLAGATFPWPNCGVAILPQEKDEQFIRLGVGCWPQVARDNSYMFMHCTDGSHRNINVHDVRKQAYWTVRIDPRGNDGAGECPRWTADRRFVVATDRDRSTAWVYLGRFADDYKSFSQWVVVSSEGGAGEADCWIKGRDEAMRKPANQPINVLDDYMTEKLSSGDWPVDHRGLAFYWRGWTSENRVLDANGRPGRRGVLTARGQAIPLSDSAADVTGGRLDTERLGRSLQKYIARDKAFTIEMVIDPASGADSATGCLLAYEGQRGVNMRLVQKGRRILFGLRAKGRASFRESPLLVLPPSGGPHHLVITWRDHQTTAYLDGKRIADSRNFRTDLDTWSRGEITFGARPDGSMDWAGSLEALALYHTALDSDQVTAKWKAFKAWAGKRVPIKPIVVIAKLTERTKPPSPDAMGAYPRALTVDAYTVTRVVEGNLASQSIAVADWTVLDGEPAPAASRKVGDLVQLRLAPIESLPHLKSEMTVSTIDDLDLPLFAVMR